MDRADVAIIGAGAVGLAVARALQGDGARVTVLERHPAPGREQSTHNSGVVHSGAFLPPGSLRAELVRSGRAALVAAARVLGVPVDECGTLAVARHPGELARLEEYGRWAALQEIPGAERLSAAEARRVEPALGPVTEALFLPSGGRIDAAALVERLAARVRADGGEILLGFEVRAADRSDGGWSVTASDGRRLGADAVVNAAGVASADVAARLGAPGWSIYPCLGEYARVRPPKESWVRAMVYGIAAPGHPGIGAHLTRGLDGALRVGPTATYLAGPTPPATPVTPLEEFAREASSLVPGIDADDLDPSPPGVRAKLVPPGSKSAFGDFVLAEAPTGARAFQLVGIESPGLTASFGIAARVAAWYGALRR